MRNDYLSSVASRTMRAAAWLVSSRQLCDSNSARILSRSFSLNFPWGENTLAHLLHLYPHGAAPMRFSGTSSLRFAMYPSVPQARCQFQPCANQTAPVTTSRDSSLSNGDDVRGISCVFFAAHYSLGCACLECASNCAWIDLLYSSRFGRWLEPFCLEDDTSAGGATGLHWDISEPFCNMHGWFFHPHHLPNTLPWDDVSNSTGAAHSASSCCT